MTVAAELTRQEAASWAEEELGDAGLGVFPKDICPIFLSETCTEILETC